jgi:hypothetical protein
MKGLYSVTRTVVPTANDADLLRLHSRRQIYHALIVGWTFVL